MFDIQNNFFPSDNFSDLYKGYLDRRDKIKKEWTKDPPQSYVGDVFQANIHRHGFYFVDNENKLFYDGLFYANKLEGYAQVFYNDGSNFQGLFKENLRFGPGIFTYPSGEQDVGLWSGQRLLRLGGVNDGNLVPRLAVTSSGQLKILKFRYLVPVCTERKDVAYSILDKLGASEEVLNKSYKLYNIEVQNKRNIFFNKQIFDKSFYIDEDCTIDIVPNDDEEDSNDDGTEQEEDTEEGPGGRSDLNSERVRLISEELEFINSKLETVRKQKIVMERNVEYCRACCSQEQQGQEENLTPYREQKDSIEEPDQECSPLSMDVFAAIRDNMTTFGSPHPNDLPEQDLPGKRSVSEKSHSTISGSTYSYNEVLRENSSVTSVTSVDLDVSNTDDMSLQFRPNDESQIQTYLMDTCICNEVMYPRDLYEMEKELETVTKDVMFFESIKKNLTEKLKMHLEKCQEKTKVKTTKVLVKDVLAWNNEDYCMRMLKQSFLRRRSEYMVNFKVSDLLTGNRGLFENPGPHERNCVDFLAACAHGDLVAMFKHVNKNDVNANVTDAKGNNGIFFAALNRHTDAIKTLVNLGAKLNQQNDEGLFPLSMCLLVYIAEKYDVDDWERSFLPDVEPMAEQLEAYKWYPNSSMLNLLGQCKATSIDVITGEKKPYIFDTSYVVPTEQEIAWVKEQGLNIRGTKSKVTIQVKLIKDSIQTLLDCGADPNVCEAPLPPLILSMFTEDLGLVESIVATCADINVTIEHDMTCLHVIASLRCCQANVDICSFLLICNLDPKLRTSSDHWAEQKAYILGKDVNPDDIKDSGKNPLHILCMRRDFPIDTCSYFEKMATIFSNSEIDFSDKYLGHTPLSLAVLVGNQKLVDAIMKFQFINPFELLDNNMGNILTVYILKRYEDTIPPNSKEILKSLVDQGVNPLRPVGEFDNAIEFMENEHQVPKDKKRKSLPGRKQPPNAAEKKTVTQKALKDYLKELARDTIMKYIQMQAVENLYNLIEDGLVEHDCVTVLAEFLTPFDVISNLQNLFRHRKIQSERYNKEICLKLIDVVKENQREVKPKKETKKANTKASKKNVQKPISQDPENASTVPYDYGILLDMTDFNRIKRADINFMLLPPGVDNVSKYKVCFHCLKKRGKALLVCPRCQLVYFCSDACNKANLKLRSLHTCNIDFYVTESAGAEVRDNLSELYDRVRDRCENRWVKKREEELELKRQKLEQEMKSDTYGLKQLRRIRQSKKMFRTPTMTTLVGSTNDLLELRVDEYVGLYKKGTSESKTFTSVKSDAPSKKPTLESASEEKYKCMVTKKHVSSLKKLTPKHDRKKQCGEATCDCEICVMPEKHADKGKFKCVIEKREKAIREKIGKRKGGDILAEANVTVKKLREIPSRYQDFVELLTRYFPEVDFSALFLPYACYSNGHLYYKFLDNDFYTRTYSMM